ncbi:MerR family transcriptional regulator [Massilia sp. PAMC28688]|uniref:MerR family transcriptional regulator n=1 Tax=Massilia sp. PAMC28688 TaxID=2861283 RepID=UPI001C62532D|nr:MerR family transcriptional regulator [Massilia sp. PAMC28688]QYF93225.1 MerR family transcriptional regulator [Massilia sp. PAMC28688]
MGKQEDAMGGMMTVGQLASEAGLPRTTIQYYEQVGLLAPAGRSDAGYRLYSGRELARVRQIAYYRATGLTLDAIRALMAGASEPEQIARRISDINHTIRLLKEQRDALLRLQSADAALEPETIDELLSTTSLNDAAMHRWHAVFERQNPDAHRTFLLSLGISESDVARIRQSSGAGGAQASAIAGSSGG